MCISLHTTRNLMESLSYTVIMVQVFLLGHNTALASLEIAQLKKSNKTI